MTLTVPIEPTLAPGETITSAWANASVRDPVNFLIALPRARMNQASTTTSASSTTWTAIGFDSESEDSNGGHSNTTNNSRYTCQVAGRYRCVGIVCWAANTVGSRYTRIQINGSPVQGSATSTNATSANVSSGFAEATVFLNAGDYVEVAGYQASGGSLSTSIAVDLDSSFDVQWVATS